MNCILYIIVFYCICNIFNYILYIIYYFSIYWFNNIVKNACIFCNMGVCCIVLGVIGVFMINFNILIFFL